MNEDLCFARCKKHRGRCRSPLKNESFCQRPSQHDCTIQCWSCAEAACCVFRGCSLRPGAPITMQFNVLWVTHAKCDPWECFVGQCFLQKHFLLRDNKGLANKLSFPFPAFPKVRQQASAFLLAQMKNRGLSPPVWLAHRDVCPSPTSPVGNIWIHAHDMSAAREGFCAGTASSRNGGNFYHKAYKAKNTCTDNIPAFFCKRT